VVESQDIPLVRKYGLECVSPSDQGDIRLLEADSFAESAALTETGRAACHLVVTSFEDQKRAEVMREHGFEYLVISCPDWKIIPFENLVATVRGRTRLIAWVSSPSEAKLALEALELGVDGIISECRNAEQLASYRSLLAEANVTLDLEIARVDRVAQLGSGLRVCIDTTELMSSGEGILVGSKSAGLFLIEAEVHQNPHVSPRPFRVNAGAVSLYVLAEQSKTRYLSEIRAGDQVLIANREGMIRSGHVGRSKIERRPMVLVEAKTRTGQSCIAVLQNAETIKLVTPASSIAVTEIKEGDEVLVHAQEGGRHFGTLVKDELVIEQ
jgi:3-dehydroquinate synthase II